MNNNTRLETRIRNIAAELGGKFLGKVPHSVFVEWDQTWDIADDLGITDTSSDRDIALAILSQEQSHDDYYAEQVEAYVEENLPVTAYEKKCARELARAFYYTIPDFQPMLPSYKEVLKAARDVIHEEATAGIKMLRPNSDVPLMPATGYDYIGVDYFCDPYHDLGGLLHACLKKCLESTYEKYMQVKEIWG